LRRALVTGGSGAIGSAICRCLAAAGNHVHVHALTHVAAAQAVAGEIAAAGGSASVVSFDITQAGESRQALEELLAAGPIQILVNNAGIHHDAVMPGMSLRQWSRVCDVTLNGFFTVTQPLLLPMLRTRWGRIITITSVAGIIGNKGQTNYAAAKAGLEAFTAALAKEQRKLRVTVVRPGAVDTPLWRKMPARLPKNAMTPDVLAEHIIAAYHAGTEGALDV